jgi:hypothetical protein
VKRALLPLSSILLVIAIGTQCAQHPPKDAPYKNPKLPVEERVADLLGRMTPRERAEMLSGAGWMESHSNARLGIPAIKMTDGPMGVRNWAGSSAITGAASTAPVLATAFPAGIGMGASWDVELVRREGRAIAQEVKALGRDMILAPTVNINRQPLWGRNFEGYGEDPYLTARMGAAFIQGVQSENVIPSVKHFAANMRTWFAKPETQKDGNGAGWLTAEKVLAAVGGGQLKQEAVDDAARRILRVVITAGLLDNAHTGGGEVDTSEQRRVARTAAAESIVLLKNAGGLLPLDAAKIRSVAVTGPSAAIARTGGGGSSLVRPKYSVTALDGIQEAAGARVQVGYALGVAMPGEDAGSAAGLRNAAIDLARKSDAAVVVVGYSSKLESEGFDRPSMDLPAGQDELIEAVAAANKNTIVVIVAGAPVTMTKWIGRVAAVVEAWYGGQEAGHAIGDILFGAQNPSGKLPVTFPKQWSDSPAYAHYPGDNLQVAYEEGIYVGYRGFDKRNVEPLFPFGHGLSYTKFDYSGLKITPVKVAAGKQVEVTARVRNSGLRAGVEVMQLYVHDVKSSVDRPAKELKGFRRVMLNAGERQDVSFTLDKSALSFYSAAKDEWVAEPGAFEVWIGASSRDIRLKGTFELTR